MADIDDDPELEFSPLSRMVSSDGVKVSVQIYRIAGRNEGWSLEVIDEQQTSTVWADLFDTDAAALTEFNRVLKEEGILSFSKDEAPGAVH